MEKVIVKLLIFYLCVFGICGTIAGQQLPIYSQFSENIGLINPAGVHPNYLANRNNINIGLTHRTQWRDLPNHPVTSSVRGEYFIESDNAVNFLVGGYILSDKVGPITTNGIYARINAVILNGYSGLSGFSGGILLGGVQYRVKDLFGIADDPSDPQLLLGTQTQFYPDVGLGVNFFHQFQNGFIEGDNISVGISMPQIFSLNVKFRNASGNFDILRTRHLYANLSYYKYLSETTNIEFSFFAKYINNVPAHLDGIVKYQFSDAVWVGFGAGTSSVGHLEAGIILGESIGLEDRRLKFGYSYDPPFTSYGHLFGNSHEFFMSYSFSNY